MSDSAQLNNYARYPVEFVRGDGAWLYDAQGDKYLDLLCGIGVTSLGHCHPEIVRAVTDQTARLMHTSNLFWTEPAEDLAHTLVDLSFGKQVFFCNSGTEANEAAIKLARAHSFAKGSPAREIVVLEGAFHGRTMGALSATPQEDKQAPFAPLLQGFKTVPRDDAQAITAAINELTCAVMLEPVQGETGVNPISDEVLMAIRERCDELGALLIFDEVQCGLGRTGSLFAYQQTSVEPDVMTLAKALGGGLPIGAMVAGDVCAQALKPGYHGSTFGGNPVACAAGNKVLELITSAEVIENAAAVSDHLRGKLAEFGVVLGRGMMIGLRLDVSIDAKALVTKLLLDHHLIANATDARTLRFLPPLTLTMEQADLAVERLSAAFGSV